MPLLFETFSYLAFRKYIIWLFPPPPWISGKFFIFVGSFRSLQTLNSEVPLSSQLSFFVCVHILLGISSSLMTKILSSIHRFISLTCVSTWLCTHICLLDTFARVVSKYIKFNNSGINFWYSFKIFPLVHFLILEMTTLCFHFFRQ